MDVATRVGHPFDDALDLVDDTTGTMFVMSTE